MPRKPRPRTNPKHRPAKPINWDTVDHYLTSGCLGTEIAAMLDVHPDTLYERCIRENGMTFTAYSSSKRSRGDAIIRDKQYRLAEEGDKTMLVWLGKQRLGQSEDPQKYKHDKKIVGALLSAIEKIKDDNEPDTIAQTEEEYSRE